MRCAHRLREGGLTGRRTVVRWWEACGEGRVSCGVQSGMAFVVSLEPAPSSAHSSEGWNPGLHGRRLRVGWRAPQVAVDQQSCGLTADAYPPAQDCSGPLERLRPDSSLRAHERSMGRCLAGVDPVRFACCSPAAIPPISMADLLARSSDGMEGRGWKLAMAST